MARGLAVGKEDMAHGAGFRRTLALPEHRPLRLDCLVVGQDDLADCVDGLEAGLEAAPAAGHALLVVVEKAGRDVADSRIVLAQLLRRAGKRYRRRGLDRVVLDGLDYAQLQRSGGRNQIAAHDHVERWFESGHTRQPLGPGRARNGAQIDFRQAEPRLRTGDPVVAAKRNLQPAAGCRAVDRRDHRLVAVLDGVDRGGEARRIRPVRLAELADVGPGNERPSRPGDDDALHRSVGVDGQHGIAQLPAHVRTDGVDRRVVQGDDADAVRPVMGFDDDCFGFGVCRLGHGFSLSSTKVPDQAHPPTVVISTGAARSAAEWRYLSRAERRPKHRAERFLRSLRSVEMTG